MFGQLRNNFRRLVITAVIGVILCSQSAFAESISGRLIYADWIVLVKDEGGVQTVMARGEPGPHGPRPVMVQFDIDENLPGENYLYIIAGSLPGDGIEPFLAASLKGSKNLETGNSAIEVFQSNYADISPPVSPVMIREIIEGGMGAANFRSTSPLVFGTVKKSLGTSTVPGIWFEGQVDNGRAVVFRLPYSALVIKPTAPPEVGGGGLYLLGGLAVLGLAGLFGLLLSRRSKPPVPSKQKQPSSEEKKRLKPPLSVYVLKPQGDSFVAERKQYPQDMRNYDAEKEKLIVNPPTGLVFENSKLVPAQGGIPSAAAAIDKAYHAVGRVGLAQDGPAIGDDESCGTAILIDEDRIMTNRHVFDRHYHRILDAGDPFGIEFFGEKDSDATEFYELTVDDVVIIDEYDAVILKLAKPVPNTNREPIKFASKPPITFDESDVLVIGYPAEPSLMTDEIEAAMGGDDVFSVKRYSEGKMFRHPQDNEGEYGIESHINGQYSEKGWLLAICHQASTLPGNSGSAVLSKETGDLIALHYGSDQFDRHEILEKHPANVAHSGMFLANSVTFITSGAFKKYIDQDNK